LTRELVQVNMAQTLIKLVLAVCMMVCVALAVPRNRREAMSDGDAESIAAFYGFYGSPIYRPYGFGSWGYGSAGFGVGETYVASPNIYGGYYY